MRLKAFLFICGCIFWSNVIASDVDDFQDLDNQSICFKSIAVSIEFFSSIDEYVSVGSIDKARKLYLEYADHVDDPRCNKAEHYIALGRLNFIAWFLFNDLVKKEKGIQYFTKAGELLRMQHRVARWELGDLEQATRYSLTISRARSELISNYNLHLKWLILSHNDLDDISLVAEEAFVLLRQDFNSSSLLKFGLVGVYGDILNNLERVKSEVIFSKFIDDFIFFYKEVVKLKDNSRAHMIFATLINLGRYDEGLFWLNVHSNSIIMLGNVKAEDVQRRCNPDDAEVVPPRFAHYHVLRVNRPVEYGLYLDKMCYFYRLKSANKELDINNLDRVEVYSGSRNRGD